jgi:hypothetical protein
MRLKKYTANAKHMNKKIAVALIIVCSALIVGYIIYNNYSNPKISLFTSGMVHEYKNEDGSLYYFLNVSINPYLQNGKEVTIYNCEIEVKYLAMNGTWLTVTQKLGTHDFDWWQERQLAIPMEDFKLDPNP